MITNRITQTNFSQSEADYKYWENIYTDKTVYEKKKTEIAEQALKRVVKEYPFLEGKIHKMFCCDRVFQNNTIFTDVDKYNGFGGYPDVRQKRLIDLYRIICKEI